MISVNTVVLNVAFYTGVSFYDFCIVCDLDIRCLPTDLFLLSYKIVSSAFTYLYPLPICTRF